MPAPIQVGKRHIRYSLLQLLDWMAGRGERLRWVDVPTSVALPAINALSAAGIDVPADLEVLRERVQPRN